MDPRIGHVVLAIGRKQPGQAIKLMGTCFAVGGRKLATAAHVTGPIDAGLVAILGRFSDISDYQDTTDTAVKCVDLKLAAYDPINDVSILEVDPGSSFSFAYTLGSSDDVKTGEAVANLGFPHADHGRLVLTRQSSLVGARVLLGGHGVKTKALVLNTQTRPGQSGGPVFSADGRRAVAMITGGYAPAQSGSVSLGGIDPQSLHQTTHAISMDYVKDLL